MTCDSFFRFNVEESPAAGSWFDVVPDILRLDQELILK